MINPTPPSPSRKGEGGGGGGVHIMVPELTLQDFTENFNN